MDEAWIPVTTSEGIFSTEVAVSITLANGNQVSLFADKDLISNIGGHESLKVHRVRSEHPNGTEVVLLPTETFEEGSRWIEVVRG